MRCLTQLWGAGVEGAHRGVLDGAVHSFSLTVGPRVVGLGQPVLDAMATQMRSKLCMPQVEVPGLWMNCSPLSVSTVWMR